jgi:hypothetical protein
VGDLNYGKDQSSPHRAWAMRARTHARNIQTEKRCSFLKKRTKRLLFLRRRNDRGHEQHLHEGTKTEAKYQETGCLFLATRCSPMPN